MTINPYNTIIILIIFMILVWKIEKVDKFIKKIFQIYLFHLQLFALPLFVESAMLKSRKKLSNKEFLKKIKLLKKKKLIKKRSEKTNNRIQLNNFVFTKNGDLMLGYFQTVGKSPKRRRNIFFRTWLGIPAILLILLNFFFIYYYCILNFDYKIIEGLFNCLYLYSIGSLFLIIFLFFSDIKKIGIYPRWIFILLPIFISIHNVNGFFNEFHLFSFWFLGLIFTFIYETRFELNEYLKILSKPLNNKSKEIFLRLNLKKPICWIILNRSLKDILFSPHQNNLLYSYKAYLHFYFHKFFERNQINISNRGNKINYIKHITEFYFVFGKEENINKTYYEFQNIQSRLIDEINKKLFLPYVIRSNNLQEEISAYSLINFSQDKIICINLSEEIVNYFCENKNLWNARKIEDIISSYIDYHYYNFLSGIKKQIIEPIDPLIDPFKLEGNQDSIKNDIASLIRFKGLLAYLKKSDKFTSFLKELNEMTNELIDLEKKYENYLEMSNIIFQAENSRKINLLTKWVVFLAFISIIFSILGTEKINSFITQFGLFEIIINFFNLIGLPVFILASILILTLRID